MNNVNRIVDLVQNKKYFEEQLKKLKELKGYTADKTSKCGNIVFNSAYVSGVSIHSNIDDGVFINQIVDIAINYHTNKLEQMTALLKHYDDLIQADIEGRDIIAERKAAVRNEMHKANTGHIEPPRIEALEDL